MDKQPVDIRKLTIEAFKSLDKSKIAKNLNAGLHRWFSPDFETATKIRPKFRKPRSDQTEKSLVAASEQVVKINKRI